MDEGLVAGIVVANEAKAFFSVKELDGSGKFCGFQCLLFLRFLMS